MKLFYEPQAQFRSHPIKSPLVILGSPNHPKFRSCLTLIRATASEKSDRSLLAEALDQFYDGKKAAQTLKILGLE